MTCGGGRIRPARCAESVHTSPTDCGTGSQCRGEDLASTWRNRSPAPEPLARSSLSLTVANSPSWSPTDTAVGCTFVAGSLRLRCGLVVDSLWLRRSLDARSSQVRGAEPNGKAPWCRRLACSKRAGEPPAPRLSPLTLSAAVAQEKSSGDRRIAVSISRRMSIAGLAACTAPISGSPR